MTIYRRGIDRYKKYQAKYVPDTVGARFSQVQSVALDRAQYGLIQWASVQDLVRPVLDKYGVTGPDRAKYIGFANKLLKHVGRQSGEAGKKFAEGLKMYYVQTMGANPTICDEIIDIVIGWAIGY